MVFTQKMIDHIGQVNNNRAPGLSVAADISNHQKISSKKSAASATTTTTSAAATKTPVQLGLIQRWLVVRRTSQSLQQEEEQKLNTKTKQRQ